MTIYANLDLGRLAFVANFADASGRPWLSGVCIEPHPAKGVVMVATDAHALAIAHDPEGTISKRTTIRLDPAARFPRAVGDARIALRHGAGGFIGTVTKKGEERGRYVFDDLGASYPDWRKVVPWSLATAATGTPGLFNFEILSRFAIPAPDAKRGAPVSLALRGERPNAPALVTRSDAPWFLGVVMPMLTEAEVSADLLALA